MGKIGFLQNEDEEAVAEEEIVIRDVDRGFLSMMKEMKIDEKEHQRMAQLEKAIRRELLILHRKLKRLSKKISEREGLFRQAQVLANKKPKAALEIIDQVDALDKEIQPKAKELFEGIAKHSIPEIHEMYREMELTNENKNDLQVLANNLSLKLTTLMREINETGGDSLRKTKANIIRVNPNLQ